MIVDKMISVVAPVYNVSRFLAEAIESVQNQTYDNWELLIVDDGSTDNSGEIADSYAANDNRIKVFHTTNHGLAVARNTGAKHAQGEFLIFFDSDDYLHPDTLETHFKMMTDDVDITNIAFYQHDIDTGNDTQPRKPLPDGKYEGKEALRLYLTQELDQFVWTKMFRRSMLMEGSPLEFLEIRTEEDFIYTYEAVKRSRAVCSSTKALYRYTFRSNSNCRSLPQRDIQTYSYCNELRVTMIEEDCEKNFPDLLYLAKRMKIRYYFITICLMMEHERKECEPYFSMAMKYIRKNWKMVLAEKRIWNMTTLTCWAAILLPAPIYFSWKKARQS